MTLDRRELLQALGVAGASAWLAACAGRSRAVRAKRQIRDDVRTWLRDAVAKLAAVYPGVHALAVTRRRTTVGLDIVGSGVQHGRREGVVLAVRDRDGLVRELATSDLTADGVAAAVRALVGPQTRPARVTFPGAPPAPIAPAVPTDAELERRVRAIASSDTLINSRIVYAAALIDIDDATVWSIAPQHDREQRLVRVRKRALRAAWAGTRPVLAEVERGWIGGVDQYELDDVEAATAAALLLTTPGTFEEKEYGVLLDPSVAATLIDSGTRALLTTTATRRPEIAARLAAGATLAAPSITLLDDPTVPDAYGGYVFDDDGQPAAAITLVDEGRVGAVLGTKTRGRRAGHLGPREAAPSHLRLAAGTVPWQSLTGTGFILEGGQHALFDPTTDRVVLAAARAREVKAGVVTGRVFADVELVGTLAGLLAAVTGVAQETGTRSYRDDVDGEPRWRSVEAPYIATRGMVRMRRRA